MPDAPFTIPLPLRIALETGECVLFLGAGVGEHITRHDGKKLPDAPGLAREIVAHFTLDTASDDLPKVAELMQIRGKRDDLEDFLRKTFAEVSPDEDIQWLCSRRWRAIFTTNYDRSIERAYEILKEPLQRPVSISVTADLVGMDPRFDIPVYHIHGSVFGKKQPIVISRSDYTKFKEKRRMVFELLKLNLATSTFLYVGYSNRDPNWALILSEIAEEFLPNTPPTAYRIAPHTEPEDAEILKAQGVETISTDLKTFLAAARAQLEALQVDSRRLTALEKTVPTRLRDAFKKNPAPVARLIASWEYTNEAQFGEAPNAREFFRGDHPNWALVGAGISFRRDIEDDLYEQTLDYVTSGIDKPMGLVVLGPAGYGITTILMNLAVRLVKEHVGQIYYLRPGADLLEGDVEFALAASNGESVCFIIDDAADSASKVQDILGKLRDSKRPALFICGTRLNELRQRHTRIAAKEFIVEPLSDPEIDRLLDCLQSAHELNKLEPLSRELQRTIIRGKHGKELLIVMRESTEDKRFDAILEDEFYGIADNKCREIYLAVCCLHQHGNYIRDGLLYDVVQVPGTEFHKRIEGSLDGIISDECVDLAYGQYAYRSRHRIISQIVWSRCGEGATKDAILEATLRHLNLNQRADADAFEKIIRNDTLIDSIHGLENKIKFFDMACSKDPVSPYIRQHYARMLYRAERYELALSQVDQGIAINPKNPPRVLIHTRGTILGKMALDNPNIDIARRRLAQAEDAFRYALRMYDRDEYAYHALAQLYLDWAKHSKIDSESALYLSKAEETISEGLRRCKEKDSLRVISGEIERWVGDQPSQLKALETAVKESPGSIYARYMLGKAYRLRTRYADALLVLDPNIKNHTDEFRSFIEYSLSLWASGKSLRECIAVLEIASVAGLSDARYIAYLGGMYFLDGNFSVAARIFGEVERREIPDSELVTAFFRPKDPKSGNPVALIGRVIVRKSTYSLIEVEGYPPFICHSSKYRGLVLKEGMRLSFEVGFTPKGASALEPKEIH